MNENESLSLSERVLKSRLGWAVGKIAISGTMGFGLGEATEVVFPRTPVPPLVLGAIGALAGAISLPLQRWAEQRE